MRVLRRLAPVFVLYFGLLVPAFAVLPDEVLHNPVLEARARAISSQLRCLVCRNETIDDSGAGLARDLRILVRERLLAGDTDRQVVDFIVARYGEYVLLKPRLWGPAFVLWLFPTLLLALAVAYLVIAYRSRQCSTPAPLSDDEKERVRLILHEENGLQGPGRYGARPPPE